MTGKESKAIIQYGGDEFFVGVTPSGHAQAIETNSKRNLAATPMELLLIALGSCTGVDVISILKKKRQKVTDYHIEVIVGDLRSEEHTSELQSRSDLVCRLLLEKKKKQKKPVNAAAYAQLRSL